MTRASVDARRCQGRDADGDPCPCREDVRYDRAVRLWLCRWCWSRVDLSVVPGSVAPPAIEDRP